MMKKHLLFSFIAIAGLLLLAGCDKPTKNYPPVDANLLIGTWTATDQPTEHWRFDTQRSGETWDTGEDVQEGEGTKFNWSTESDQLRIDLYGQMGQHVYYDWTVTHQTPDTLTFKDIYDLIRTFVKI